MIKKAAIILAKRIHHFFHKKKIDGFSDFSELLCLYSLFVSKHSSITYSCNRKSLELDDSEHKYVGIIGNDSAFLFVPNDSSKACVIKDDSQLLVGDFGDDIFKYTGGCFWNNEYILFPRKSNYYAIINANDNLTLFFDNGEKGTKEHHYGGVCTNKGIVYQPPRSNNTILSFNITTRQIRTIRIGPRFLKYRYCGSVLHPNGFIYFLPEDGYVIVFNPNNEKWSFLGKRIRGMVYDAKVGFDGNIYGFTAYGKGIMKIDVINNSVSMIFPDQIFGSYGTKLGVNGKLYSVPGNSNKIWEFDYSSNALRVLSVVDGTSDSCFYAGGMTSQKSGTIYASPIKENSYLIIKPSINIEIPIELYDCFYKDCY